MTDVWIALTYVAQTAGVAAIVGGPMLWLLSREPSLEDDL